MSKKTKYPKLPNGYGSIRYLGKGRRNAYSVHPPTKAFRENGTPERPAALCYVDAWIKGFTVLTAYKAGTYYPGYENTLTDLDTDVKDLEVYAQKILSDYNQYKHVPVETKGKTFAEVYEEFYKWKYETDKSKEYSDASKYSTRAAFKNCSDIHDYTFTNLRHVDLQSIVDDCPLRHASLELIIVLLHQMYEYAVVYEISDVDYSRHLKINIADDDEHGIPFSNDELAKLWKNSNDEIVEFILIMCYSGFRISAYKNMKINTTDKYFQGGVKTSASKDRIVPIHSAIYDLVERRIKRNQVLLNNSYTFRQDMYEKLNELEIEKHTPHDCRHTFSKFCEDYHVLENDRKRMLGHSFGSDITNRVYGHRDLEDLRIEIEKIKIVTNL